MPARSHRRDLSWPTLEEMSRGDAAGEAALLDEWRAEVGDEAIAAAVHAAAGQIAEGRLPGFSDKHEFLEYLRESRRRSA